MKELNVITFKGVHLFYFSVQNIIRAFIVVSISPYSCALYRTWMAYADCRLLDAM